MAILGKLHTFRGDSRFTTWAHKFALLEAGVKVRRRAWQGREVPLEADGWAQLLERRTSPAADAETSELLAAVRDAKCRGVDSASARRARRHHPQMACRSTSSPSGSRRHAAPSTRRSTTRARS
jgi:RNA polymerase sigma-70 factor (ECF subfamily)